MSDYGSFGIGFMQWACFAVGDVECARAVLRAARGFGIDPRQVLRAKPIADAVTLKHVAPLVHLEGVPRLLSRLGVIPDRPANYVKSPLGVTYEQINEGVGDPARPGDVAVFHWILRRANGYFIYGSVDCGIGCGNGDPSEYVLGPDGRLIPGLDELLTGMRPGEKRRALVPPELGYVSKGMEPQPPEFGQKRQVEVHAREPLVFEVKLIKVRNKRAA